MLVVFDETLIVTSQSALSFFPVVLSFFTVAGVGRLRGKRPRPLGLIPDADPVSIDHMSNVK